MTVENQSQQTAPTAEFVSQAEFARRRGCSRAMVTKWKKTGRLVMTDDGQVDVAASEALIGSASDPLRGGDRSAGAGRKKTTGASTDDGYVRERTREAKARADKMEIELAEKAGALVRRDLVEAAIFDLSRRAMEALRNMPDRLAPGLAVASEPGEVRGTLEAEIERVCGELARSVDQVFQDASAEDAS